MPLSEASWPTRVGIAAVATAVAVGLVVGVRQLAPGSTSTHAVVEWQDGGPPADARCLWLTGLIDNQVAGIFHLTPADGGQYVYAHICGSPIDGGTADVPSGMLALSDTEGEEAYDGGPQLEVWTTGDSAAPWPCACSSGSNCQVPGLPFDPATLQPIDAGLVEAPVGQTLQPGWVGTGCQRKTCVELGGVPYWPSGCPRP